MPRILDRAKSKVPILGPTNSYPFIWQGLMKQIRPSSDGTGSEERRGSTNRFENRLFIISSIAIRVVIFDSGNVLGMFVRCSVYFTRFCDGL